MEILKVLALRGPNIWARSPVLEAWVDLGALKDSPSDEMPGFNDRLIAWLPTMIEHRCSVGERGGFFERLRRGTYLAHILEHVSLELQALAGNPVGFGRARETEKEGLYKVAIKYVDESVGRAALDAGRELCLAAVHDRPFDVNGTVRRLRELADRVCLGPSTMAIVEAARARGIPHRRLNAGSLVQLGQGRRQRRIWTAETDRTSAIAESIAQDKELTKSVLGAAGVPVPEGRIVDSAEDAWQAAKSIGVEKGVPVVIKPRDANHARGVFVELTSREAIEAAYGVALKEGSGVLVERFARGAEHRLLVVGDKLIAACRGDAASVTGDGRRTIRQLIADQINSDPRRGDEESHPLSTIEIDAVVTMELQRQDFTPDSIPAPGVRVLICRNDNLSRDVTDDVHPDVAECAVRAAQAVGLDIAGLDIVAEDIGRPLDAQGGVVVEVNAGPGLLMHLKPRIGTPRPVGEAIVSTLFPPGETGRIPLVAVTGTNGKTITTRLIRHLLKETGRHIGMTTSDGTFVGERRLEGGDCAGPRSARNVLLNPIVEAAVFECGRGGILREGLGFDFCDVAVVTNIAGGDHLGQYWIESLEKMFAVKRSAVDVVLPTGFAVLNADDPLVAEMGPLSRGGVIYFSRRPESSIVAEHRSQGARAVLALDGRVVLATGRDEAVLTTLDAVPLAYGGRVPFQVENVLAAAGAAWALDVPRAEIARGLATFQGDADDCPGRFNVLGVDGKTVILDDCRNASALRALVEGLEAFGRPWSIVYAADGDRRDQDILEQGRVIGESFTRVATYEAERLFGREPGEASRLLRQGIAEAGRAGEILGTGTWDAAVNAALASLESGGTLVIQAEDIATAVDTLRTWPEMTGRREAAVSV